MCENSEESKDRFALRRAINSGDSDAITYLYKRYKSFLTNYIERKVASNSDAQDLVEDIFLCLCEGKCKYPINEDVRGYLCGIAKNVVQSHLRKKKYQIRTSRLWKDEKYPESLQPFRANTAGQPEKTLELSEFRKALQEAIAQLPEKSRQAIELVLIQEIRPCHAAEKAGCSPVVFRNRLSHGLKTLRKKFSKFYLTFGVFFTTYLIEDVFL